MHSPLPLGPSLWFALVFVKYFTAYSPAWFASLRPLYRLALAIKQNLHTHNEIHSRVLDKYTGKAPLKHFRVLEEPDRSILLRG